MAGLADDWEENRQTCIDVLCAYLRMPFEPQPDDDAPVEQRLAFRAGREVRHTVVRVIAAHLTGSAAVSWRHLHFDFTGVVFDDVRFTNAVFTGYVTFENAEFSGGWVSFGSVRFDRWTSFANATFSGGWVDFRGVTFSSAVIFSGAKFSGGTVSFEGAEFSSHMGVSFEDARFSGGTVRFNWARFSGGTVRFDSAKFIASPVDFSGAKFSGAKVDFTKSEFSGGIVDFRDAADWSDPPAFSPDSPPPTTIVKFPVAAHRQS